jgi:predicted CopG family antitoxin
MTLISPEVLAEAQDAKRPAICVVITDCVGKNPRQFDFVASRDEQSSFLDFVRRLLAKRGQQRRISPRQFGSRADVSRDGSSGRRCNNWTPGCERRGE